MRVIALCLLFLISGCAPFLYSDSIQLSEEELRSSDNPVWVVEMNPALETATAALKTFHPNIGQVIAKEVGADTQRFRVRELESAWLEGQKVLVMLAFQGGRAVLLVLNLENRSGALETDTVAAKIRVALMAAMDAKFQRGQL
jgi:hypothetical protein